MKKDLLDVLRCPVSKGELELTVEREEDGEVIEGTLYCEESGIEYEIDDGIPDMLPPESE